MGKLQRPGLSPSCVHVVVPGALGQRTGGFIYDARMVSGLRDLGWQVTVHELEGRFPNADERASTSLRQTLTALPHAARVVLDGLAMGGLPEVVTRHADRLRLIALVHHALSDETGLDRDSQARFEDLERQALAACRGVIVTSAFTAARLARFGVAPERICAVPPGVDPAPVAQGAPDGAPPQLLCVGSVTPRKGQEILVNALGHLRQVAWQCVCAGSLARAPAYAETVKQRVDDLGLSSRFDFPGECDGAQLDALYATSTAFVLPSFFEGYGMALTEALARGLPIVSTTGGAIPFTVPADAAVLVSPGDEAALTDAIGTLLEDASRLRQLRDAAWRHAETLPRWDAVIAAFGDAIDALTEGEQTNDVFPCSNVC